MDLDDQFLRYFGTSDISALTPAAMEAGVEHMLVDFGLETDRDRRFALWVVLQMLGAAPGLEVAFPDAQDRDAARNFMNLTAQIDD